MGGSPQRCSESLLVLVGITATRGSRRRLERFFESHGPYRTFVPNLPLRRGIRPSARWLHAYLTQTMRAHEGAPINVLAYIAGGAVLRCLASMTTLPALARIVHVRGPVQELVPAAMIARYGRLLARILGGRSMIDLAEGWPQTLPLPPSLAEQALIVEEGVSALARSLGLGTHSVPAEDWDAQRLLPGASEVLRLPASHDDAYTSGGLLSAALAFFRAGRFGTHPPAVVSGEEPDAPPSEPGGSRQTGTLVTLLDEAARSYPDDTALVLRSGLRDERWTYRGLQEACVAIAIYLREVQGLRIGDRVLVCSPNQPRLVAALFGAMMARVIPVPLDPFSTPGFAAEVARDTEAKLIISERPIEVPGPPQIRLAELPTRSARPCTFCEPAPGDIAEIIYTSGTTGKPKGVVLTHANILTNVHAADALIAHSARWRLLSLLPLSHMLAQTVDLYAQLYRGSTIVYGVPHHPAAITKALQRYRISTLVVVPQVLAHMRRALEQEVERRRATKLWNLQHRIAEHLPLAARRILWARVLRKLGGSLEVFICGGAHLSADVAQFWERMGVPVVQGYGATECSPIIAGNTLASRVADSVGRAVNGVQVRLSADGEVQVHGASVFSGYWRNEPATHAAFTPDGWYRTGDLAASDAVGNLHIKGRLKDMVALPSGLNVFLEDLDAAFMQQPGIRGCVCLDVARAGGGIGFVAIVIGPCSDDTMRSANALLAPHQRLNAWLAWDADDFPRTTLGKVKRGEVRAWFEGQSPGRHQALTASAPTDTQADKLAAVLSEVSGVDARTITAQTDLKLDLALNSLSFVELALALEDRFGVAIDDGELGELRQVGELTALLDRGPASGRSADFSAWPLGAPSRAVRGALQGLLLFAVHAVFARPFAVMGRENLRALELPALFIANHASHFDTVSILRALPSNVRHRLAVAAAADYFYRCSALGSLTSLLLNTFPFARQGGVRASLEYCGELADRGWSVLIYPEGTRSPKGVLLAFKSGIGLLATGLRVPVVPIAVLGGHTVLPKGSVLPRPGRVCVAIGAPIRLPPETPPAEAVRQLHQAVADLMISARTRWRGT